MAQPVIAFDDAIEFNADTSFSASILPCVSQYQFVAIGGGGAGAGGIQGLGRRTGGGGGGGGGTSASIIFTNAFDVLRIAVTVGKGGKGGENIAGLPGGPTTVRVNEAVVVEALGGQGAEQDGFQRGAPGGAGNVATGSAGGNGDSDQGSSSRVGAGGGGGSAGCFIVGARAGIGGTALLEAGYGGTGINGGGGGGAGTLAVKTHGGGGGGVGIVPGNGAGGAPGQGGLGAGSGQNGTAGGHYRMLGSAGGKGGRYGGGGGGGTASSDGSSWSRGESGHGADGGVFLLIKYAYRDCSGTWPMGTVAQTFQGFTHKLVITESQQLRLPAGVADVQFTCVGGGGAGAAGDAGGAGGGAGGVATSAVSRHDAVYDVSVGAGGKAGGASGTETAVTLDAAVVVVASGGHNGAADGGAGGFGNEFAGGTGGKGLNGGGGGGGGAQCGSAAVSDAGNGGSRDTNFAGVLGAGGGGGGSSVGGSAGGGGGGINLTTLGADCPQSAGGSPGSSAAASGGGFGAGGDAANGGAGGATGGHGGNAGGGGGGGYTTFDVSFAGSDGGPGGVLVRFTIPSAPNVMRLGTAYHIMNAANHYLTVGTGGLSVEWTASLLAATSFTFTTAVGSNESGRDVTKNFLVPRILALYNGGLHEIQLSVTDRLVVGSGTTPVGFTITQGSGTRTIPASDLVGLGWIKMHVPGVGGVSTTNNILYAGIYGNTSEELKLVPLSLSAGRTVRRREIGVRPKHPDSSLVRRREHERAIPRNHSGTRLRDVLRAMIKAGRL